MTFTIYIGSWLLPTLFMSLAFLVARYAPTAAGEFVGLRRLGYYVIAAIVSAAAWLGYAVLILMELI